MTANLLSHMLSRFASTAMRVIPNARTTARIARTAPTDPPWHCGHVAGLCAVPLDTGSDFPCPSVVVASSALTVCRTSCSSSCLFVCSMAWDTWMQRRHASRSIRVGVEKTVRKADSTLFLPRSNRRQTVDVLIRPRINLLSEQSDQYYNINYLVSLKCLIFKVP